MCFRNVITIARGVRSCRLDPLHVYRIRSLLSCWRLSECSGRAERYKYTQHQGVKGIRNRKVSDFETNQNEADEEMKETAEPLNLEDSEYDDLVRNAMHVTRELGTEQNVLIVQPYVKWGPKRNTQVQPDDQLREAEALVRSLPNWSVVQSLKVPLESLERKHLFGSGKMEELKALMQKLRSKNASNPRPITCLFVSKGSLSFAQKRILESEFKLPVMDRYSVVIQILRLHATSAEARIQVAMAEIPYIWAQVKDANLSTARRQGWSLTDSQREILKSREKKLKNELERIRSHRKLLRNKRKQKNYPVVAVVGYTNAGKTSLIKALTREQAMQPRDQLFATLDVTAHAGVLPCNLEVIYMDTVGFMSDLPTGLIECFVTTLEDAMLADVIVHVQDLSHVAYAAQRDHVENTLNVLASNITVPATTNDGRRAQLPPIINVGNKVDLVGDSVDKDEELLLVSAKEQIGLHELLLIIERKVLAATDRRKLTMRVRSGGREMAWLYKNATVTNTRADAKDAQLLLMDVLITASAVQQFKRQFCQ